ncbi:unnamed protein product [Symbiodinium natans]|uniref:Uncharacterized protein n=1 Tax=Symbiodinium natans TaxID=878477 RepID=A0A812SEZ0_9DINO|nr:unnamed protein product [Symbiodinium natans]
MADVAKLREAALREVIWRLGGSARRLERAFSGPRRGLVSPADFEQGLRQLGLSATDLQGLGYADSRHAFSSLDHSARGALLLEELTRKPTSRRHRLSSAAAGTSNPLRRSPSVDSVSSADTSSPIGLGIDAARLREELDELLVPLRQREEEVRQLRLEVEGLQRRKDRASSRQVSGAVRARSEQQRRVDELTGRHRQKIEELQGQAAASQEAERVLLNEARDLQHAAHRSARMLRQTEEDCAQAEVHAEGLQHAVEKVLADTAQRNADNEELRAKERALHDKALRLEALCSHLRGKVDRNLPTSPQRKAWDPVGVEAAEVAREEALGEEVESLRRELLREHPDVRRRNRVLALVAEGISELSSDLQQKESKSAAVRAEMAQTEHSIEALQRTAAQQASEMASLRQHSAEARQAAEDEMQGMLASSDQRLRLMTAETAERTEALQKEVAELRSRSGEMGARLKEAAPEPAEAADAQGFLEAALEEQQTATEAIISNVQSLRAELAQEHKAHATRQREREEEAQKAVSSLEEMAERLTHACFRLFGSQTDGCDALWRRVALAKQRAAESAAASCEAGLPSAGAAVKKSIEAAGCTVKEIPKMVFSVKSMPGFMYVKRDFEPTNQPCSAFAAKTGGAHLIAREDAEVLPCLLDQFL